MSLTNSTHTPEEMPVEKAVPEKTTPEAIPEQKVEQEMSPENEEQKVVPTQEVEETATSPVVSDDNQPAPALVVAKTEEQKKVEGILSDGLADLYSNLPDNRKDEFKQKGEETASQIVILLQSAKVKVGKMMNLINGWLTMIPGVNKFFLEQDSKIKADRLLEYKKDKEEGRA